MQQPLPTDGPVASEIIHIALWERALVETEAAVKQPLNTAPTEN